MTQDSAALAQPPNPLPETVAADGEDISIYVHSPHLQHLARLRTCRGRTLTCALLYSLGAGQSNY